VSARNNPLYVNESVSARNNSLYVNDSVSARNNSLYVNDSVSARNNSLYVNGSVSVRNNSLHVNDSVSARNNSIPLKLIAFQTVPTITELLSHVSLILSDNGTQAHLSNSSSFPFANIELSTDQTHLIPLSAVL